MDELMRLAADRAIRYLRELESRHVAPRPEALERLTAFDRSLPESAGDPRETIELLDDIGSPATVTSAGPRFFGFVVGGSLPVTVASNWLAAAWDQNAGGALLSPVAAKLEQVAERWLVDLLKLPPQASAAFVSGATMANLSALAAARHAVLRRAGWDVESDGLFGAPPISVVLGEEAHPSVRKALGLLGLGRTRVVVVPVDGQGRMQARGLSAVRPPAIVCLQAGNVNTGAFDPFAELVPWAHEARAWVHIDGAFGLWAAASPARAHLLEGAAEADSWATDAHKWLNTPYDSGLAFVREPEALRAAMAVSAAYLPFDAEREPAEYTPELSRRARGVEVWAALRTLGRSGVAELIDRDCRAASRLADGLASAGFTILNDVVLNQVLVSFGDDARTRRVIAAVQEDGTCWCGGTVWQGRTAMRISVSSWATTDDDVDRSLAAMLRAAQAASRV
ncbi:MAG TPA: pyridoxal-dependent decarboxylase [Thermoleophilia bacterium]|nr:pyridoxal-dependent decarboxylase [Thermoleophilia bacterium]